MKGYIRGTGCISPQKTYDPSVFLNAFKPLDEPYAKVEEPNYKDFIQPMNLRRMGRILKMGVTSAGIALKEAGIEIPDAIITGTGLGLVQDTEKFLTAILENNEKFLTPTSFIQSTHNTVGAHIAVMLKCNHYNFTYVHSNISFESALLDSLMHLDENPGKNILLGGLDEMTENYFKITQHAGLWKKFSTGYSPCQTYESQDVIGGEGAAFFVLTGEKHPGNYARFTDTITFHKPANGDRIVENIREFLKRNELQPENIDLILLGQQDANGDEVYNEVKNKIFGKTAHGWYKHLCGEYYTSSAFAAWLAANILKRQIIPDKVLLTDKPVNPVRNILIHNHFRNINHSLMLLTQA